MKVVHLLFGSRSVAFLTMGIVALALGALLLGVTASEASHYRYGHTSWAPAGGNNIDFSFQEAWRRDSLACIDPLTGAGTACTGTDGFAVFGDVVCSNSTFDSGSGVISFGTCGTLPLLVNSIDLTNNWLFGQALDPASLPGAPVDTLVRKTYPAPGNYLAHSDGCCRIGIALPNAHINNTDGPFRVETLVNVGTGNSSPVSGLPPIVTCPLNALCSFQVPATDPNGDALNYRLSTSAEAGGFTQPGPPDATNAAGISSTGLYTWNTTGATLGPAGYNTLYSTQVTIEDRDTLGNVKSKVAVDFLIQLQAVVGSPPVFNQPPTPICGSTITGSIGNPVSFTVQASDPDSGDIVTLNVAGLPSGATMTPALPTTGNPVSSVFNWTPGATGTFVVNYTATDQTGQQALCSITIVINATTPTPTPVPPPGPPVVGGIAGLLDSGDQAPAAASTSGDGSRLPLVAVLGFLGALALAGPALYLRRRVSRN